MIFRWKSVDKNEEKRRKWGKFSLLNVRWLSCFLCFMPALNAQVIKDGLPENPFEYQVRNLNVSTSISEDWKRVDIPFQYINDLIIVEIVFEGVFPLKFVFDTGAEHTILTKKEITDLLGTPYKRTFTVYGADMKQELTAYLISEVSLKLGPLVCPNEALLVLAEDYFKYEELTGLEIHGILGANFFRQFIVDIDYQRERIRFYKHGHFNLNMKKFKTLEVEVKRNKPYLLADLNIIENSPQTIKLLFDTGAALPLLIYTATDSTLTLPDHAVPGNIGFGLGGYLSGYKGRIHELAFSAYSLNELITNFQISDSLNTSILASNRNGIMGNQVISQFRVIIDYWKEVIYLKPNKNFNTKLEFDKSGLVLIATGNDLNTFVVQYVVAGSPADIAGIEIGDQIIRFNLFPSKTLTIREITQRLKRKEGKKIKLKMKRGDSYYKTEFRLKRIL